MQEFRMSVVQRRYERRPPPKVSWRRSEFGERNGSRRDSARSGMFLVSLGARWVGPVATVPGGD